GNHARYLDNPGTLAQPGAVDDGNGILGHVFGSRDVSRQVAARASAQTGISADILKRLLPLVATMVMASFAKQRANGGTTAAAPGGDITGMLGSLLDSNRDGSIVDDVTSMLGRFMGRQGFPGRSSASAHDGFAGRSHRRGPCPSPKSPRSAPRRRRASRTRFNRDCRGPARPCATFAARGSRSSTYALPTARSASIRST